VITSVGEILCSALTNGRFRVVELEGIADTRHLEATKGKGQEGKAVGVWRLHDIWRLVATHTAENGVYQLHQYTRRLGRSGSCVTSIIGPHGGACERAANSKMPFHRRKNLARVYS
jgi:hypothetical protein